MNEIQPAITADRPAQSDIAVLIVDDKAVDRKLFSATLNNGTFKYSILEASDIEEGLACCQSNRIDCVLLDQNLRGQSGVDWISDFKIRADAPHLPVIMLTGAGDESLAVSALHAGAADYLSKSRASTAALERSIHNSIQKADLYREVEEERSGREAMHVKLRQKNEELQSLYHTVSHELKTPLTAARELVSLLLDEAGGPLSETQRDFLDTTLGCCDRLSFLLNNWLDTVRSETGKLQLNLAPSAIAEVVRQTVKTYDVLAQKNSIKLISTISDVGIVQLDPERFQQTLTNLLSNAFKFTEPGGQVEVICRNASEEYVEVLVADSGRGIPDGHLEQIFSPFFQSQERDTRESQGMGLGLHVCRTIVDLHGGELTVQSKVGSGSTFKIQLPRLTNQPSQIPGGNQ